MEDIFFIYPNTLFKNIKDYITSIKKIYVIEEPHFFTNFKFHKQKLILHRASMKYYFDYLKDSYDIKILYVEYHNVKKLYNDNKNNNIYYFDVLDHSLNEQLLKKFKNLTMYENQTFMESINDLNEYNNTIKNNNYRHDDFYKWNRSRLNIFMNNNKPLYGKFSFDSDNRNNFDKNYIEPSIYPKNYYNKNINDYLIEAIKYVKKNFEDNFGEYPDKFIYPITHSQAFQLLKHFLKEKIHSFGSYQDACSKEIMFGSHSLLSSSLNIGLITVSQCVVELVKNFESLTESNKKKLFNNYEGFLRQIIGWRSFTRLLYYFHGKEMFEMNYFKHENTLNKSWYNGTTNIEPIDFLIHKINKYAYIHHIERLMYIGNWMLLCQIHPKKVYEWFMITCIDSYDWVMVSNVHGMSQYALNTNIIKMMTRPYICSSNYIKNMSDFNTQEEWAMIWNNLYYYFLYSNINYLKKNYYISRQIIHWKNKSKEEQNKIIKESKKYLEML
jgi:deoxyribodipyrimidine photolyase-related protein